jgi:bacterioferritin-associated ferredoxin
MFICMCLAVTEVEVRSCISGGARTVEDVAERSFACTGCGGCRETIEEMLAADELAHSAARLCALPQRA